ncbi:hypothetical protein Tco_0575793 [Tanacetum coccineum]
MVKTQQKLETDEILCAVSVFSMQGDISELVFDDGKGTTITRKDMQSLAPGILIQKELLNEEKDFDSFENVIKNQMNASESKKKMKDVELAFFPTVVSEGQYYVIVFNL